MCCAKLNVGDLLFRRLLDKTWLSFTFSEHSEFFQSFKLAYWWLIWLSGNDVRDLHFQRLLRVDESWLFSVVSDDWNIPKFRTRSFILSSDFSLRNFRHMASVVCFFEICYGSNAMTFSNYFSNFVIVCVDFLCLNFGVQLVRETARSLS